MQLVYSLCRVRSIHAVASQHLAVVGVCLHVRGTYRDILVAASWAALPLGSHTTGVVVDFGDGGLGIEACYLQPAVVTVGLPV